MFQMYVAGCMGSSAEPVKRNRVSVWGAELDGKSKPDIDPAVATVTVVDELAVPPVPLHDSEKVLVAVSAVVGAVPLVALLPFHDPPAVHAVALVLDHDSDDA